ncbi:2Fe-2S iron-sulfur cluster-binding protein [Pandoraea communis]|uniref:2Fe-2S iron-sulfur cluster-binding protein n=1 Tax=Pandoraea TaxID=93217 RepID=UPI0003A7D636|nr:2Fe-2S iron-sulfur cluster-binding protein [Pandoraea communis]
MDSASPGPVAPPIETPEPARYRVTLMPSGWQFDAPAGTPILLAAQAAGFKLPSLCRNGTCRACLCQAQTGGEPAPVAYRIEWPGLSREEKGQGWLLPCCAYARADLVIDAPDAALC